MRSGALTPCGCESSYCDHAPAGCPNAPEGRWAMDYVGLVCDKCAATATRHEGGVYLHPLPGDDPVGPDIPRALQ